MKTKHDSEIYSESVSTVYVHMFTVCIGLFSTDCVVDRFGHDCEKKCHCYNPMDACQLTDGRCTSGCADHFTGDTCQGNAHRSLADGIFLNTIVPSIYKRFFIIINTFSFLIMINYFIFYFYLIFVF